MEQVMTAERQAAVSERMEGGPAVRDCVRALAAADLLGVVWPKEFGGRGFSAIEQFIFAEEARRVNAPIPLVTLTPSGDPDALRHRGAEADVPAAILEAAPSSPSATPSRAAGSDLASLRTNAVRDGDDYVINGQKMFTSGAAYADYIWLAARTARTSRNTTAFRSSSCDLVARILLAATAHHAGVSLFYTFYDNVRVPASAIVAGENQGWQLITTS